MAQTRRIIGIVVVVLGIVLLALPFSGALTSTQSAYDQSSGSANALTPAFYGGGTLKVTWSGAGSATTVTLYSCPNDPGCGSTHSFSALTVVASGSGASGSLSASVTGGQTYLLAENGTAGGLTVTVASEGFGLLGIIGLIVAIVGIVLVVLPVRKTAGSPSEPTAEDMAPTPEETVMDVPKGLQASNDPEPAPVASTAVAPGGSGRPAIKCPSCGTMNEPWITNCRWCKRSLTTTG